MSTFTTRRIDLNDLDPDDPLWGVLKDLTMSGDGWEARRMFNDLRPIRLPIGDYVVLIVAVVGGLDDGRVVAWGAKFKDELWAYTHPNYYHKGIQRDIVMPYWKQHCPSLVFQTIFAWQKETAKYYYGVATPEEAFAETDRRTMASFEREQMKAA